MKRFNFIDSLKMSGHKTEADGDLAVADEIETKEPKKYKVLIHNDDYTTMEFVVHVLQKFFSKSYEEAQAVMLKVHNEGFGVCGIYTYEVAESKSSKVNKYSRSKGHPLKSSIEPCDD